MPTTFQEFGGKSAQFHDLDLLVLMKFVLAAVPRGEPSEWQDLTEAWKKASESYGPGVIELQLDKLLANPGTRAAFVNVIGAAERQISGYGATVPGDLLNHMPPKISSWMASDSAMRSMLTSEECENPVQFKDYAVAGIMQAANKLKQLLL